MAPVTRPPPLNASIVVRHVTKYFPFKNVEEESVRQLVSYDDRNYFFQGILEEEAAVIQSFVFKVNHAEMSSELVEGLNAVMNHLHTRGVPCPVPLCSRQQGYAVAVPLSILLGQSGQPTNVSQVEHVFCLRVLAYINGENAVTVQMSPDTLFDIGAFVGRIDHVLQGFTHPAIDARVYEWDIKYFLSIEDSLGLLEDVTKKHMAETVFREVGHNLVPRLNSLQQNTIHGDCNEQNILVDPLTGRACGIVDFGDCVRTCRVFELAILIAYCILLVTPDPIQMVVPVIDGYLSQFSLEPEELDMLYYAVLARLCKSVVTGYATYLQDPSNIYLLTTQQGGWAMINLLLNTPKCAVDEVWFRNKVVCE